jgi:HSP20 family protein
MKLLTHWNPIRDLQEFNRVFNALQRPATCEGQQRQATATPDWVPVVDVLEDEKEYVIKAELPEVVKEDVRVVVDKGRLTISGERKLEKKEENGAKYHRVERSYGSFLRSFNLPENADPEKVDADFKDGVLRVRVAKLEQAQPRQIEVKVD